MRKEGAAELAVSAVKKNAAVCRVVATGQEITVRLSSFDLWKIVPGEVISVLPRKMWDYKKHRYLSGTLLERRFEVPALKLAPLRLEYQGEWDPGEIMTDDISDPSVADVYDYLKPLIAAGKRAVFEMEQVVPGLSYDDDYDPILEAIDRKDQGDTPAAEATLMRLLAEDLRCLDAHAHLGNFIINANPEKALRHYLVGVSIGELSLPEGFDGFLLWRCLDNRPYLRCLHGHGLCLWRLERYEEAEEVLEKMLRLNPPDNQGARFVIDEVRDKTAWHPDMR